MNRKPYPLIKKYCLDINSSIVRSSQLISGDSCTWIVTRSISNLFKINLCEMRDLRNYCLILSLHNGILGKVLGKDEAGANGTRNHVNLVHQLY